MQQINTYHLSKTSPKSPKNKRIPISKRLWKNYFPSLLSNVIPQKPRPQKKKTLKPLKPNLAAKEISILS
jgi:hypothetical protein